LSSWLVAIKDTKGFSQRFLEAHLRQLSVKEDWETFMDVIALTLYGVMLFPYVGDYVDIVVVDIFVAVRTRFENLVIAILADTYLALDLCYETRVRKRYCCLPMLYIWSMARNGDNVIEVRCPIELVTQKKLEIRGSKEWAQSFAGLNQLWQPSWKQRKSLIYSYADFPNVPLIGTKGCINYNPVLAQRQFGYPIRGAPNLLL